MGNAYRKFLTIYLADTMVLSEKSRYKLLQRLRSAFGNEGDPRRVIERALLDVDKFKFQGSIREIWTGIVEKLDPTNIVEKLDPTNIADDLNKRTESKLELEKFLNHIVSDEDRTKNDKTLKEIFEQLKSGYKPKLPLLAKALSEGRCVLFLGPNMLQVSQGTGKASVSFNELVASRIVNEFNREDIYYDKSQSGNLNYVAQLFSKRPEYALSGLGELTNNLYKNYQEEDKLETKVYERLADLPFSIIVNTNPDDLLASIIKRKKPGSCVERYYDPIDPEQTINQPPLPEGKILFYNLLGTLSIPQSIQLTESQLISFTSCMVRGKPSLDTQVRLAFNDQTTHYLFLGFDFDQWYMKLVVGSILGVAKQNPEQAFSTCSTNKPFSAFNREFYEDEFKFYFIDEDDLNLFVMKLVKAYQISTLTHGN